MDFRVGPCAGNTPHVSAPPPHHSYSHDNLSLHITWMVWPLIQAMPDYVQ
jgi:hypothetical protein